VNSSFRYELNEADTVIIASNVETREFANNFQIIPEVVTFKLHHSSYMSDSDVCSLSEVRGFQLVSLQSFSSFQNDNETNGTNLCN